MRKTFALAAVALAVGLTGAQAQEKVWKHGILEAKSDAGFITMVDKGGFAAKRGLKIELLQIKAGATLMKALLSGEIDSVDMGAAESIVAGARGTAGPPLAAKSRDRTSAYPATDPTAATATLTSAIAYRRGSLCGTVAVPSTTCVCAWSRRS